MEYTSIPNLNQKVARIGLGTWSIGGWMWGGSEEKDSISTIHQALDEGINLIDTAPVYGFGESEKIVGKALKQYGKRNQIVIATKVGLSWKNNQVYRDTRKKTILKEIEDSLRRLQTDYIDLYIVHWPDSLTPFDETAETLDELLKQGKIRAIGVSNFSIEEMKAFRKKAALHALQSPFNLFERAVENSSLAYCAKEKIAFLGYGSLCRGLLTGQMTANTQFKGDDLRKVDPKFQQPRFAQYLECVERLKQWAQEKHRRSVLSFAIRWALDKAVSVALWGARRPQQLQGIHEVWGWKLHPQDFKEVDSILKETILSPVGPEFMAPPLRDAIG